VNDAIPRTNLFSRVACGAFPTDEDMVSGADQPCFFVRRFAANKKEDTGNCLHGVFRRGENAPLR
jgi:hypothetical protein